MSDLRYTGPGSLSVGGGGGDIDLSDLSTPIGFSDGVAPPDVTLGRLYEGALSIVADAPEVVIGMAPGDDIWSGDYVDIAPSGVQVNQSSTGLWALLEPTGLRIRTDAGIARLACAGTNVLDVLGNGGGIRLTSPDGATHRTLSIDNAGTLVVA